MTGGKLAYVVARLKLAFGRTIAVILDLAYLRRDPGLQLIRIGTDYGGWYCVAARMRPELTAMCCGAGEDISFDVALNAKFAMNVVCVDPTPRAVRHVTAFLDATRAGLPMLVETGPSSYDSQGFRESSFRFVGCAVWSSDGVLKLFAPRDPSHVSYSAMNLQHTSEVIEVPSRSVASLMLEFGIQTLSLLKLDIEGAEYQVIRSILKDGIRPLQLLVEFDQVNQPLTPTFWVELVGVLNLLRQAGYRLIYRERANFVFLHCTASER